VSITLNRLINDDIPGMHRELRNSLGHLKELGWVATSLYLPFRHHYRQLIDKSDLMIFIIKVNGKVAGAIEIEDQIDNYFIGYWLGFGFRGRGIITQCIQDIIQHDLAIKKPITARVGPTNKKSISVLERLGFLKTHHDQEWIYYQLAID